MDGLKGFPEAIETVFPKTAVQLCIVHMVRYSLNSVSWKLRKAVATDLRAIYSAATVAESEAHLAVFVEKWGEAYPPIMQSWRRNWARLIPFFRLSTGNPQGDLHHQRHGARQHETA